MIPIRINTADIHLFKLNYGNAKTMCKICSKLAIKGPQRGQWRCSCVFIVNFEQIWHNVPVFPLLILNKRMPPGKIQKGSNSPYFFPYTKLLLTWKHHLQSEWLWGVQYWSYYILRFQQLTGSVSLNYNGYYFAKRVDQEKKKGYMQIPQFWSLKEINCWMFLQIKIQIFLFLTRFYEGEKDWETLF